MEEDSSKAEKEVKGKSKEKHTKKKNAKQKEKTKEKASKKPKRKKKEVKTGEIKFDFEKSMLHIQRSNIIWKLTFSEHPNHSDVFFAVNNFDGPFKLLADESKLYAHQNSREFFTNK